jgi:transcriptional regulator with XRE-family HTH domain
MAETAASLLRQARIRAGLTQRALAERANTAQSVVARVEGGQVSPSWDTLERLLNATGFALEASLGSTLETVLGASDVPRVLTLDPALRLQELRNADRFFSAVQRVS